MGMGAEMLQEMMCDEYLADDLMRNRETWDTKDGRMIKIIQMETAHIENTIAYLERNMKVVPSLMYEVLKIREAVKYAQ
jgi:hypothetical protein